MYESQYQKSLSSTESFWSEQARQVHWEHPPATVMKPTSAGNVQWFPDGELNTCYLALDYHVEQGRGEQVALYYDSPATGTRQAISYQTLLERVARFAGAMRDLGVSKGDRVIIYMPMVPEAAIAMLACARLGAPHSVVFGGFAANELAMRIDDAQPALLLTASCGIELSGTIAYKPLVDKALELAQHQPVHTVVLQRPMMRADMHPQRDLDWYECQRNAQPAAPVTVRGSDPLYILYTSGTTGKPKGIVRDNGSHAVALNFALRTIYGMEPGDVWWGASDIGWVVGHSFIVYAPLMGGCSSIFFEGKPIGMPDASTFWRVIAEYRVKAMFCAPTAFRAIRKEDSAGKLARKYDLSCLEYLLVAGEKLDTATYDWLCDLLEVPVYDHWWQTETGWPMTSPLLGWPDPSPPRPGSTGKPVPGYDIAVLDDGGNPVPPGDTGNICVRLPMPPGVAWSIWQNPERFASSYLEAFPGYYHTGDGGFVDDEGYVFITGRTDDVINVSGHRLSTGDLEEVVASHPEVAECAVIGINDELRGQLPLGLVILRDGSNPTDVESELVALVRQRVGAVACFRQVIHVARLPKTRSGKILRAVLRKIAAGQAYTMPSTIDDESILGEVTTLMQDAGVIP